MPITQQIDKEAVRLLAIEIGLRPAARQLGLNEDTVCSWASRGNWFVAPANPQTLQAPQAKPGDILLNELREHERETRMSLAKAARRMAEEAETADLDNAKEVHDVAKVMAIVHRQDQDKPGAQFSLNVLNLNMFSDDTDTSIHD